MDNLHLIPIDKEWSTGIYLSLLVATLFLLCYLKYQWKSRYLYQRSKNVTGPKGWPLIGNIMDFGGGSEEIYNTLTNYFNNYPNLYKMWFGPALVYGVSKPEYLEAVLTSPHALSKMYLYKYAEPVVGHGLFTAPVTTWKSHRKIIMRAFNQKVLDRFVEVFARQSTIMGQHLKTMVGGKEFDLFPTLGRCTLDINCETAMGICVDGQSGNSTFGQWVDRMMEIGFLRMVDIWYHFDATFKLTQLYHDFRYVTENFKAFTSKVIDNKLASFGTTESAERKAFLDLLIELSVGENKLSKEEIRDEVNTFMIAGSDSTASTTSFVFMMLAMHPEIQTKVYEEVTEILGPDRSVEPQDLLQFKYTERVIKETMRVFPVAAYIARDIKEEIRLKGSREFDFSNCKISDGFVLAKDSSAVLGIMAVHRNGDIWPDPLKFDPDRFLSEAVSKRHPFAYLPFSGGPRNCVGPQFAMMSVKTIVATIIRDFEFATSYKSIEEIKLKTNLVLRPKEGYKVSIKSRK